MVTADDDPAHSAVALRVFELLLEPVQLLRARKTLHLLATALLRKQNGEQC